MASTQLFLAPHLVLGYYQTAFHENKTASQLLEYLRRFALNSSSLPALVPVGADHRAPPPDFKACIERLQAAAIAVADHGDSAPLLAIGAKTLSEFNQEWQSCLTASGGK